MSYSKVNVLNRTKELNSLLHVRRSLVLSSSSASATMLLLSFPILKDAVPASAFGVVLTAGHPGRLANSVRSFTGQMSAWKSLLQYAMLVPGMGICPYLSFVAYTSLNLRLWNIDSGTTVAFWRRKRLWTKWSVNVREAVCLQFTFLWGLLLAVLSESRDLLLILLFLPLERNQRGREMICSGLQLPPSSNSVVILTTLQDYLNNSSGRPALTDSLACYY